MFLLQKEILFLFAIATTTSLSAQQYDSIIRGRWVTKESTFRKEIESSLESSYLQYHFDHNNIVSFGSSQYELGQRSDYAVVGNTLKMYKTEYSMEGDGVSELVLSGSNHLNQSFRITLVRKEIYDAAWSKHNPALKISPWTFSADFPLYAYVFSTAQTPKEFDQNRFSYYQQLPPPRYDEYLNVKFLIDLNGTVRVTNVTGLPIPSNSATSRIKKRIESTSGRWTNLEHSEFKNDTVELIFLKRGKSTLDFRQKAFNHFQKAIQYFTSEDYAEGMNAVNKAIALQDMNFQFYILRSLFYLKKDNLDKYCGDIIKARELNPLITLTQSEIIEGEVIQIKCGNE